MRAPCGASMNGSALQLRPDIAPCCGRGRLVDAGRRLSVPRFHTVDF